MDDVKSEETIFAAARELPRHERTAFVEDACNGDARLREAVEALLNADEVAGKFLHEPVGALPGKAGLTIVTERPGDRIGRYKLLQQIGHGGCGIVYVAEQEESVRRLVALKVIKVGMDTNGVVARFEAERQALALMDHPNIAKVLDAGATSAGRPFFVMELVHGIKLTDFCDKHNLSTRERLELFAPVCRAVQHAHQKGIIHRDLKPSNILVTLHDGVPIPKVIDFGIAKATQGRLTEHTVHTALEQLIGTPAYMSPEQAGMSGLDVDTRSDIYSLGVLLYELLIGRTPFDAERLLQVGLDELRRLIREQEPVRPSTRLTTMVQSDLATIVGKRHSEPAKLIQLIRGDLDWIVMKCLEKDRNRRYETANGLTMDILRYLNNEPILARPPSRIYQLQKFARRNRGSIFAASAVTLAALLALIILAVSNTRISREKRQREQALKDRGAALEAARASESHAKEELFFALRNEAQARRYSGQMGQRFESLAALDQAVLIRPSEGLRDDVIASLARPDIRRGPKWKALEPTSRGIAFDSLYERYARIDEPGIVTIRSIVDDRELQRLNTLETKVTCSTVCAILFSPDGRYLAMRDSDLRLHLWDLADGAAILGKESLEVRSMAFSPDSRQLAVGLPASIVCFDVRNGNETRRWAIRSQAHSLAFHPDNRRLAVGYVKSADVSVYDADDGSLIADLPVGAYAEEVVAWHPDGQHLATAGSDPRIQIWDLEAKRKVATLEGNVQQVTFLSFHPGGELIASGGWEGVVRLWDPASARQVIKLPFGILVGFNPRSRWFGVAFEDEDQAQLFEATPSLEYHTFIAPLHTEQDILYVGDIGLGGRLLAMGMDDGVHLWDLATRTEVAFLSLGTTLSVHFQNEGHELVTCGPSEGLQVWMIQENADAEGSVRFGPPRRVTLPFTPNRVASVELNHIVVVASEEADESLALNLETGSAFGKGLPHSGVSFIALSKSGRWLASAGWHSNVVRLWDVGTSKLVHEWTLKDPLNVCFTPSGDELVICQATKFDFVDLKTFTIGRTLRRELGIYPGHIAFSSDGTMMAMEMAPGTVDLKEVSTGRTVAKLEDPFGDRATWMSFTPDGTQLVVAARYAGALHLWDLRALRVRLKTMGLDWNWLEFSQNTNRPKFPFNGSPLRVQLDSAQIH